MKDSQNKLAKRKKSTSQGKENYDNNLNVDKQKKKKKLYLSSILFLAENLCIKLEFTMSINLQKFEHLYLRCA